MVHLVYSIRDILTAMDIMLNHPLPPPPPCTFSSDKKRGGISVILQYLVISLTTRFRPIAKIGWSTSFVILYVIVLFCHFYNTEKASALLKIFRRICVWSVLLARYKQVE